MGSAKFITQEGRGVIVAVGCGVWVGVTVGMDVGIAVFVVVGLEVDGMDATIGVAVKLEQACKVTSKRLKTI